MVLRPCQPKAETETGGPPPERCSFGTRMAGTGADNATAPAASRGVSPEVCVAFSREVAHPKGFEPLASAFGAQNANTKLLVFIEFFFA